MAWKPVGRTDLPPFHKFEITPEVEGVYESVKSDVGANKKQVYTLRLSSGNQVSIWGSTVLDEIMEDLEIGSRILITFKGTKPTKRGKNEAKIFTVDRWEE